MIFFFYVVVRNKKVRDIRGGLSRCFSSDEGL